jgi:superfamily II DNA or RNA helicase
MVASQSQHARMTPRPHQLEALSAIARVLEKTPRATVVMACGSGKTLVEHLSASKFARVLILEPSLALIAQSLEAARMLGTTDGRTVVCVCSDKSVAGSDEWRVSEDDLGVPVTTDLVETRRALEGANQLLAFCTYQSVPLLADALPSGFKFDVVVYDEAHRTAGARDRLFSKALDEHALPAKKRLFATATPRHTAPSSRPGEVDPSLVYSMDDPAIYGEVAYQLTLPEAIDRGVCADYEVLVSVCTGREARDAVRKGHELLLPQPEAPVDEVAVQLSIARACEETGARRVISFHRTIEEAREFAEDRTGILEGAGLTAFHINGDMTAAVRREIIEAFVHCEGAALLSNARCLTEGVDVPSVDMICFAFRKQSQFEIVQAVGRALRVYPGKKKGYILLPVFIDADVATEAGDSLGEIVARSDFAVTWDVLHNILEADASLAERMRIARTQLGYGNVSAVRRIPRLRVLAADTLLERLESSIAIRAVRRLTPRWDESYGAAKRYSEQHGGLRSVPKDAMENGIRIASWLHHQRVMRKAGKLSQERIDRLNSIGMMWRVFDEAFAQFVDDIGAFRSTHGHFNVPNEGPHLPLRRALNAWRTRANTGQLSLERMRQLTELGVPMSAREEVFQKYVLEVKRHVEQHGGAPIPRGGPLKNYIIRLRQDAKAGKVPPEWIAALSDVGFDLSQRWKPGSANVALDIDDVQSDRWEHRLTELKAYVDAGGSLELLLQTTGGDLAELARWTRRQRRLHRRGRLPTDRFGKLDALGLSWTKEQEQWQKRFEQLRAYREQHRHQRLATKDGTHGLMKWIDLQRVARESGRLYEDRVALLNQIGFAWSREDERWEYFLMLLKEVADSGTERPDSLTRYLSELKRHFLAGNLSETRRETLSELGVAWAAGDARRAQMLKRLELLARKVGANSLRANLALDPELKRWVTDQRRQLKAGAVDPGTLSMLEARALDIRSGPPAPARGGKTTNLKLPKAKSA